MGSEGAGSRRRLAAAIADCDPDVVALFDVGAGDALALATRFAYEWVSGSGAALLWRSPCAVQAVHDDPLPASVPLLPFDRRSLLRAEARIHGRPVLLYAVRFSAERGARVRELRGARSRVQGRTPALLFTSGPLGRIGFDDRGLRTVAASSDGEMRIHARGIATAAPPAETPGRHRSDHNAIVAVAVHGIPPPQ